MKAADKKDPLPIVLLILTITTGLVDAITVLGLGRVFAANMTGNVVFSGFAIFGAPGFSVARCGTALAGFFLGAMLGGRLTAAFAGGTLRRWLLIVAVVEMLLYGVAALISLGYDIATLAPEGRLYTLIALTSVAMGLRNATVRRLAVPDLTTTVLTLTITGLASESALAGGASPRWGRRVGAVLAMFIGAGVGTVLVYRFGLGPPLLMTGAIILLVTCAYCMHPASGVPATRRE